MSLHREAEAQHDDNVKALFSRLRERHLDLARKLLPPDRSCSKKAIGEVEEIIGKLETFVGGVCLIGELSRRSEARIISTGEVLSSTIITTPSMPKACRAA